MHTDPIADMITRIKNAALVGHETTAIPYSGVKEELAKIFVREGFLQDVQVKRRGVKGYLIVTIPYQDGAPLLHGAKRISSPGKRIYAKSQSLYPIKGGYGHAILSTPKGLLTDTEARRAHVGGEIICHIW